MNEGYSPCMLGHGVGFKKGKSNIQLRDRSTKHRYLEKAPIQNTLTIGSYAMYYFKSRIPEKFKFLKIVKIMARHS